MIDLLAPQPPARVAISMPYGWHSLRRTRRGYTRSLGRCPRFAGLGRRIAKTPRIEGDLVRVKDLHTVCKSIRLSCLTAAIVDLSRRALDLNQA
jgi:hypothetical protein